MFVSGTAPQLYALSQNRPCEGKERCHWCGAPCGQLNRHDEPPPPIMRSARKLSTAKVPSSAWICNGCFNWRRQKTTMVFPDRSYQDGQRAELFSWLIDEKGTAAVRQSKDQSTVWQYLLHPPTQRGFCISLVTSGQPNYLHQAVPNFTSSGFTAASPITFTLNNVQHQYSVQELEGAVRTGVTNGKEPGVRVLLDWLGPPPSGLVKPDPNAKNGRPEEDQGQQQRRKV